jgi:UPF0716 protein FxsA
MFIRLLILFSIIPVIEITLLIKVGSIIGVLNTVLIVVLTAVAGAYLVRSEGLGVMHRMQKQMSMGIFPGDELINGAMLLVAGALLLTPGFFTDTIGFLLVLPATRGVFRRYIKQYINSMMDIVDIESIDREDDQS